MRRYNESRESSSELLRMVIPMMSAHKAGMHPVSYATWYEYAAGINQRLKRAIDQPLTSSQSIDDTAVYQIHDRYIAGESEAGTEKLRQELTRMISGISDHDGNAGEQTRAYTFSLDRFSEVLHPEAKPAQLQDAVSWMRKGTGGMRLMADALQQKLEQNALEIETPRRELQ